MRIRPLLKGSLESPLSVLHPLYLHSRPTHSEWESGFSRPDRPGWARARVWRSSSGSGPSRAVRSDRGCGTCARGHGTTVSQGRHAHRDSPIAHWNTKDTVIHRVSSECSRSGRHTCSGSLNAHWHMKWPLESPLSAMSSKYYWNLYTTGATPTLLMPGTETERGRKAKGKIEHINMSIKANCKKCRAIKITTLVQGLATVATVNGMP